MAATREQGDGINRYLLTRVGVPVLFFVLFWSVVWLLQWWLAPTWLVGSAAGLQTLLQALPGATFALLALIFASLYLLGQQAANVYGFRAVAVLISDPRVFVVLARAIVLALVPLFLGGQVPDEGAPCHAVTAATATVVLAVGSLVLSAANTLLAFLGRYTAPRSFVLRAVEDVEPLLRAGALGLVVFRVSALGEMLRSALRRGEGVAVAASLEGLSRIQQAYVAVASERPSIRFHHYDNSGDEGEEGWLGEELSVALTRAGEEALRTLAVEEDIDLIARTLEAVTATATQAGHEVEARDLIEGLARLGVSSHQVRPETINLWPHSAAALARVEALAEQADLEELAADALAAWGLVCAYPITHFGVPHPAFELSLPAFGPAPPFERARAVIERPDFGRKWNNKLELGIAAPLEVLRIAAGRLGIDLLDWPEPPEEFSAAEPEGPTDE